MALGAISICCPNASAALALAILTLAAALHLLALRAILSEKLGAFRDHALDETPRPDREALSDDRRGLASSRQSMERLYALCRDPRHDPGHLEPRLDRLVGAHPGGGGPRPAPREPACLPPRHDAVQLGGQ